MPLIEEIEIALPFVAELPESQQRLIAMMMAVAVRGAEDKRTMTEAQRERLRKLDTDAAWRRLRDREE